MKFENYRPLLLAASKSTEINVGTVQGYTKIIDDTLYIIFSASNDKLDWLNHMVFMPTAIPYDNTDSLIRVHSGWIQEYQRKGVRDYILAKVKEFTGTKVVCSGHSYGAVLATYCSVDLQYNFPDKAISCAAFSPPHTGNQAFIDSYMKRVPNHKFIFYGADIVTMLPPEFMGGYKEFPDLINFGKRDIWKVIINTAKTLWLWASKKKIDNLQELDLFGDHNIYPEGKIPSDYEIGF